MKMVLFSANLTCLSEYNPIFYVRLLFQWMVQSSAKASSSLVAGLQFSKSSKPCGPEALEPEAIISPSSQTH